MQRNDDRRIGEIIRNVLLYLQQRDGIRLVVTSNPDRVVRNAQACDAVLGGEGCTYAVEHTRLDSYGHQGADQARFVEVLDPLRERFWGKLDDDLYIAVPVNVIPSGYDWTAITSALETYILAGMWRTLQPETVAHVNVAGVPFPLAVRRTPCSPGGSLFIRRVVFDARGDRMAAYRVLLERKAAKFQELAQSELRTVLVIESDEAIIANREMLFEEFAQVATRENTEPYDDVLLIMTGTAPWCLVPLKIGSDFPKQCEPRWPAAPGYAFGFLKRV